MAASKKSRICHHLWRGGALILDGVVDSAVLLSSYHLGLQPDRANETDDLQTGGHLAMTTGHTVNTVKAAVPE
jgi:hypothetical protein